MRHVTTRPSARALSRSRVTGSGGATAAGRRSSSLRLQSGVTFIVAPVHPSLSHSAENASSEATAWVWACSPLPPPQQHPRGEQLLRTTRGSYPGSGQEAPVGCWCVSKPPHNPEGLPLAKAAPPPKNESLSRLMPAPFASFAVVLTAQGTINTLLRQSHRKAAFGKEKIQLMSSGEKAPSGDPETHRAGVSSAAKEPPESLASVTDKEPQVPSATAEACLSPVEPPATGLLS